MRLDWMGGDLRQHITFPADDYDDIPLNFSLVVMTMYSLYTPLHDLNKSDRLESISRENTL